MFNEKSEQFKITKVTSELVVDVQPKEISIALLEDKALVEFQKEGRSASFNVGNMYLGRVKKLRRAYYEYFTDTNWLDMLQYDLCINSSTVSKEQIIQMVKKLL